MTAEAKSAEDIRKLTLNSTPLAAPICLIALWDCVDALASFQL